MLKRIVILTVMAVTIANFAAAREKPRKNSDDFFFEAVVFRSDKPGFTRIDLYALIPYETLEFVKAGSTYGAKYKLIFEASDSTGSTVRDTTIYRTVYEDDYFTTQGGAGDFEAIQIRFYLPPGAYRVEANLLDIVSKREYQWERNAVALDFDAYDYSLSGVMLVSSIEEKNGRMIITPHVSDNVGELENGFFIFFEAYDRRENRDSVDFVYEIIDSENKIIAQSERIGKASEKGNNGYYIKIPKDINPGSGAYALRLIALKPSEKPEYSKSDYLALTQRSLWFVYSIAGAVTEDIDKAIKQLRYVAGSEEIERIEAGETRRERIDRFEKFWKDLDPTPNTLRNEAFQEYFRRIKYANDNFKAYSEGWTTDMGMIYVIYGPPAQRSRYDSYGGKTYERWIYDGAREFIFLDNSGFGDFRLVRPYGVVERYKYNR